MTATRTDKGHPTYYDTESKTWKYTDNHEPIENNPRPCKRCGHHPTPGGYDHCLGYIKGAKSACCGHGTKPGYIIY